MNWTTLAFRLAAPLAGRSLRLPMALLLMAVATAALAQQEYVVEDEAFNAPAPAAVPAENGQLDGPPQELPTMSAEEIEAIGVMIAQQAQQQAAEAAATQAATEPAPVDAPAERQPEPEPVPFTGDPADDAEAPARQREFRASAPTRSRNVAAFSEQYGLVVENNIFLRDRTRRPSGNGNATTRPTTPQRSPEQTVALTGIVFEDGAFRAYFENLAAGTIFRVSPGDEVARGRVKEILIDAVAYESNGGVTWIEIGRDLTGSAAARPTATAGTGATTAPAGAEELLNADPATLTVEQRMRLRALQQRGGGR
jgi:hypothetical protein